MQTTDGVIRLGAQGRFFLKIYRAGLIAVSAFLPSTSPHNHRKIKTAFGPSGGDFSLEKTGLMR